MDVKKDIYLSKIRMLEDKVWLLEHIISSVPGHVWWKDKNLRFLGCNDQQALDAGFNSRDLVKNKSAYDIITNNQPEKERIKQAQLIDDVDRSVIATEKDITLEEFLVLPDGGQELWLSKKKPLYDKGGNLVGLIGVSVNITAQKEAEQLKYENIKLEAENKLNQMALENKAVRSDAERLKLENELHKIKNEAYLAEKQSQVRVTKFIDKMLHEIQSFRVEELNEKLGVQCNFSDADKQIKLTKREQQILYFLSLNKSPKNIAQIITVIENKSVSDSTINAVINKKLYPKFEVFNIGQLIEKAVVLKLIPFLLDN